MKKLTQLLFTLPFFAACSSPTSKPISQYEDVARSFNEAAKTAQTAFLEHLSSSTENARTLAVTCRLQKNMGCKSSNTLQPKKGGDEDYVGFARYACAGTENAKALDELNYVTTFSAALENALKKPDDSFLTVLRHIDSLKQKNKVISTPDPNLGGGANRQCVERVITLTRGVEWNGKDALGPETPLDATESVELVALAGAMKELFDIAEKAATKLAQTVDETKRKEAFRDIVLLNADKMHQRLASDGPITEILEKIYRERLIASLRVPYATYRKLSASIAAASTEETEIYALTKRLNAELAMFDRLRNTVSPGTVVVNIDAAYTKLENVATEAATPKETLIYLQVLIEQLQEVAKLVGDAGNKAKTLNAAMAN